MASDDSSFQPGKPHPQTKGAGGSVGLFIVAAAIAAMVIMILAIWAPRLFGSGATRWLVTLGLGALAFAAVLGIGFARRS